MSQPHPSQPPEQRSGKTLRVTLVGLGINLALFAAKLLIALGAGAVSIAADAVNNLSDAASCVITLAGFMIAARKPDSRHPFGHGRMEYLSGMAVSILILWMGITLAVQSVRAVIQKAQLSPSWPAVLVLGLSVLAKVFLYFYYRAGARKWNSISLRSAATDSLCDTAATLVILLSMLLQPLFSFPLDGIVGVGVSLFILWEGAQALFSAVNPLLGSREDAAQAQAIVQALSADSQVLGVHDLIIHDYGPTRQSASVHVELDAHLSFWEAHQVADRLEKQIHSCFGVDMVIHADPVIPGDARAQAAGSVLRQWLNAHYQGASFHDLRVSEGENGINVECDILLPFACPAPDEEIRAHLEHALREKFPACSASITVDRY